MKLMKEGGLNLSATDLSNHLSCKHLTNLEIQRAEGTLVRPERKNAFLDRIIDRGLAHEEAYVRHLESIHGSSIVKFENKDTKAKEETINAMQEGINVIVQGALANERWGGRPDILVRVNAPSSSFGDWSYQAADTKLTRTTKAGTILQLCVYSDLLNEIQGVQPHRMIVVMPDAENPELFTVENHRLDAYAAYYRLVRNNLLKDLTKKDHTYPEPTSHCDICKWWPDCEKQRRTDDHLTFVAGIQKSQIKELKRQGITTLTDFATAKVPLQQPPKIGTEQAYNNIHQQAKIQHKGITTGEPEIEFRAVIYPDEHQKQLRGFLKLPPPDEGDLFFDIESARHAPGGGLEYLLGYAHGDESNPYFDHIWGLDRAGEKAAFEQFIDLATKRLHQYPDMHVYHFAPYEPVALKRLATRHATREEELDNLLRKQCFVDLYSVTRQSIIASVESYSIKCLEAFYGYQREEELADARNAMHELETLLELGAGKLASDDHKNVVLKYNRDDCVSTLALRDWLEELRSQQIEKGIDLPRPPKPKEYVSADEDRAPQVQKVFNDLTDDLDDLPPNERTDEQNARWLLAHSLEYFRREKKNAWWEYYRLRELDTQELLKERLAINGLAFVKEIPPAGRARIPTHVYSYPEQFTTISEGADLYEVTSEGGNPKDFKIGTVESIDLTDRTIEIKKTGNTLDTHPVGVFHHKYVDPQSMPETLLEFGRHVAKNKNTTANTAQHDLLYTRSPRFANALDIATVVSHTGITPDSTYQLISNLDHSVLAIQGPPGTGKTYTGSHVIAKLLKSGKRVGITAVSHAVIDNLLTAVQEADSDVRIAHRGDNKQVTNTSCERLTNKDEVLTAIGDGKAVGATTFVWAAPELEKELDYLFIDEAGQMSLAVALTAARAARNVILLGDPQQLEQPQKAAHPEGSQIAALAHLIGDQQTISSDQGLFLDTTYRMYPTITKFTSEQYYDSKLLNIDDTKNQIIVGTTQTASKPISFIPVKHTGNQSTSEEEASQIVDTINTLLSTPHQWIDRDKEKQPLTADNILVMAPYNAQVALLKRTLPDGVRVGTVDKFQGQEAPLVIYSLTSSTAEEAPRGMSFLFNPNRYNVATRSGGLMECAGT